MGQVILVDVVRKTLDFKKRPPLHYWARLLLAIVLVVHPTMAVLVGADTFDSGTGTELGEDDYQAMYGHYGGGVGCRGMNGTLWQFVTYRDAGDATNRVFEGYWSENNGTSWSGPINIMDDTYPTFQTGGYPRRIADVCVLSNNSIVLLVHLYKHDTTVSLETHLLVHWNNSDLTQWERITVYSSASYHTETWTLAVNSTDQVLVCYTRNAQTYQHFDHWDPASRAFTRYQRNNAQVFAQLWALVDNSTDAFQLAYEYGTTRQFQLRTADGDWTQLFLHTLNVNYHVYDAIKTGDGTFCYVDQMTTGGALDLNYRNASGTGTRRISTSTTVIVKPSSSRTERSAPTLMKWTPFSKASE